MSSSILYSLWLRGGGFLLPYLYPYNTKYERLCQYPFQKIFKKIFPLNSSTVAVYIPNRAITKKDRCCGLFFFVVICLSDGAESQSRRCLAHPRDRERLRHCPYSGCLRRFRFRTAF
nr:MAG TPA: hypothetical protein [Caudoviricetes sp.]